MWREVPREMHSGRPPFIEMSSVGVLSVLRWTSYVFLNDNLRIFHVPHNRTSVAAMETFSIQKMLVRRTLMS